MSSSDAIFYLNDPKDLPPAPAAAWSYESVQEKDYFDSTLLQYADLPKRECYMSPWLLERTITLINGRRGLGKTWMGMTIAVALTHDISIGPWKVEKPVPVIYLDGEMSIYEIQSRLRLLVGQNPKSENLGFWSCDFIGQQQHDIPNLANPEWQRSISNWFAAHPEYKVFIIDNVGSLFPGLDENDKAMWDPCNRWLLNLKFHGVSIIMIHHLGKDTNRGARGTSAREDNIDVSINLVQDGDSPARDGAKFKVEFTKHRGIIGRHAESFTLSYVERKRGVITWESSVNGKPSKQDLALCMIMDGIDAKEIQEVLELNKQNFYRVKVRGISAGYIDTKDGKSFEYTPAGVEHFKDIKWQQHVGVR